MSRGRFPMRGWSAASPLVCDYRGFVPCHASAPAIAGAPPTSSFPQAENRSMTTYRAHSRQWVLHPINTNGACNHYKSGLPRYFRSPRRQQYVGAGFKPALPLQRHPLLPNVIPNAASTPPVFPTKSLPSWRRGMGVQTLPPVSSRMRGPMRYVTGHTWGVPRVLAHAGTHRPPLPSAPVGATLVVARPRPLPNVIPNAASTPPVFPTKSLP